jgi:hypothetical protein
LKNGAEGTVFSGSSEGLLEKKIVPTVTVKKELEKP